MQIVNDLSDLVALANDDRNKGKTFEVTKDVFDHYASKLRGNVIPIDAAERQAVECLLGVTLSGATLGLTRACICAKCNHRLSFVDHVASAILSGAHTVEQMRPFMIGSRYWLTIDTDQLRLVVCPRCYRSFAAIHCCYSTSSYAYV